MAKSRESVDGSAQCDSTAGGGRLGAFRAYASPNPVTGDDEWSKSGVVSEVASRVSLSKSEA